MNKLIPAAALAAALAVASSANAADIARPVYKAAPMAPVYNWSGFYIGVNAGYISGKHSNTVGTPTFTDFTIGGVPQAVAAAVIASTGEGSDLSAFFGGGQIGYNWQFGRVVTGIEADIQASSRSGQVNAIDVPLVGFPLNPILGSMISSQRFNYFGTVRARLGYTAFDNLLVYVTGGLAYGEKNVHNNLSLALPGANTGPFGTTVGQSKTATGFTVGGGFEYKLDAYWSVKGEALYYDLGKTDISADYNMFLIIPAGDRWGAVHIDGVTDNKGVIARVGLNYKFN